MNEEAKTQKLFVKFEVGNEDSKREKELILENHKKIIAAERAAANLDDNVVRERSEPKSAEEKEYLLLMVTYDEESGEPESWFEFCHGRTAAYEFIKLYIDTLDIVESHVLVEGVKLEKRVTVYNFCKYIKDKNFYPDDTFNIEEYNKDKETVITDDDENESFTSPETFGNGVGGVITDPIKNTSGQIDVLSLTSQNSENV